MYRVLGWLLSALNLCASALTAIMMILIGIDVFGRALFGAPLYGVPEFTKLAVVCIVWLQMAYTLHVRKHLRAETFLLVMPWPARRVIEVLNAVIGALIFGVIAHAGFFELMRSWTGGVFEGEYPVRIPVWPVWFVLTLGAGLTALEFAVQAASALSGRSGPQHGGGAERGDRVLEP